MPPLFTPSTPLEKLIHSGDYDSTIEFLRPQSVAERGRHRAQLVRINKLISESRWKSPGDKGLQWDTQATKEQQHAAGAATALCGTADDVASVWFGVDDIILLSQEFELPCLVGLADAKLRITPNSIDDVQKLLVSGLITRPETDDYILGLIALPRVRRRENSVKGYFAADPGLVNVVLRMFDIEGTGDTCLASIDKYNSPENTWSHYLLSMCREGILDRAVLLDKTLSALERDWPQFRSGWFTRFHIALTPTVAELSTNAARYLQLCHSRIPPTVSFALDLLSTLDTNSLLDPAATLAALRPVMSSGSKGQIESALKLLDRCVARDPQLAIDADFLSCAGLVHEAAPLQNKILQRLAKRSLSPEVKQELRRFVTGIAASNRATILRLIGEADSTPVASHVKTIEATNVAKTPASALDEDRRLADISDMDELIQSIAYVFENDTDIDAFERTLKALVVAAPDAAKDRQRFGPVLKRAGKLKKPVAVELARLLVSIMEGKRLSPTPSVDNYGKDSHVHIQLIKRIDELMDLVAQGKREAPLSSPTHRGGFIAPSELIARVLLHQQNSVQTSLSEQVLALLRLAPGATAADRQQARQLASTPFTQALLYALGDDVTPGKEQALFCAAARLRHPQTDDALLLKKYGDLGPDGPKAASYQWEVKSRSWGTDTVSWTHEILVETAKRPLKVGDMLAVARHPLPSERQSWGGYHQASIAGIDPALIAYSATIMPFDLEAFFAEGVRTLGNNLEWWEAQWQNKVYLEPLLDATVTPGPMGYLLLACALAGREPGQTALAVDAFVCMHVEGRLNTELLFPTLQRLFATPAIKFSRYRKSLDAALRIEPHLAPTIINLLSTTLPFALDPPPKDIGLLLELLHELLISTRSQLAPEIKSAIANMKISGNGKAIQKKIVEIS